MKTVSFPGDYYHLRFYGHLLLTGITRPGTQNRKKNSKPGCILYLPINNKVSKQFYCNS